MIGQPVNCVSIMFAILPFRGLLLLKTYKAGAGQLTGNDKMKSVASTNRFPCSWFLETMDIYSLHL